MCAFKNANILHFLSRTQTKHTKRKQKHNTTNTTNKPRMLFFTLSACFVKPLSVCWEPLRHPLRHPRRFFGEPLRHPLRAPGTLRDFRVPTLA